MPCWPWAGAGELGKVNLPLSGGNTHCTKQVRMNGFILVVMGHLKEALGRPGRSRVDARLRARRGSLP